MIHLREQPGTEQLTELPCIDLIGLRAMKKQATGTDRRSEFYRHNKGDDDATFQGGKIRLQFLQVGRTFKNPGS